MGFWLEDEVKDGQFYRTGEFGDKPGLIISLVGVSRKTWGHMEPSHKGAGEEGQGERMHWRQTSPTPKTRTPFGYLDITRCCVE